jgi:hypothetical protein
MKDPWDALPAEVKEHYFKTRATLDQLPITRETIASLLAKVIVVAREVGVSPRQLRDAFLSALSRVCDHEQVH